MVNWAERTSPGPFLDLDGIRQGLVKFIEALIKNTVGGEKSVTRLVTDWRSALEDLERQYFPYHWSVWR